MHATTAKGSSQRRKTGPETATAAGESASSHRPSEERLSDHDLEHLITTCSSDLLTVHTLDGTCLFASGETMPLIGVSPDSLRGRRLQDFVRSDDLATVDAHFAQIRGHGTSRFRYRFEASDGSTRWVETRLRRSADLLVAVTRDIDHEISRQSAEWTRLRLEARTDWLTQLKNRWGLEEVLEAELDRYRRNGRVFSVALVDVDGFKQVNDRNGHGFGDHVLRRIAALIEQNRRSYDVLGRWGGDEFLLVLPETSIEEARLVAGRMVAAVDREWPELGEGGKITLSAGVIDSRGCETIACMTERADQAMYRAKAAGGNQVCMAEMVEPEPEPPVEE